ncbi:CD3324 family protein [Acetatifactor aquisgranensis]|uniref:CD3324 family protein n=1 Tax=Acetatifactor aquisgranensis TaxID=2941233 RepID=UPI00203BF0DD|nr:CD3324 family protein [Acetatifactor aquisgranensis]
MKYLNAAEILPEYLLKELQAYVDGEILYVPKTSSKKEWGAANGSRVFYQERNREIQRLFQLGFSIDTLADRYGLAYSTIKKIVYG